MQRCSPMCLFHSQLYVESMKAALLSCACNCRQTWSGPYRQGRCKQLGGRCVQRREGATREGAAAALCAEFAGPTPADAML